MEKWALQDNILTVLTDEVEKVRIGHERVQPNIGLK